MKEQRKYIRYDCDLILAIALGANKVIEAKGKSYNLSQGGVKFSSDANLDEGLFCKIAFDHHGDYQYAEGTILRKNDQHNKNECQ